MSELPDIDFQSENVEYIAFFNAIQQGDVAQIAPEEMLDNSNLSGYELYDNGWTGRYDDGVRELNVRCKTDGWVVAYLSFEREFGANLDSRPTGPWDLARPWTPAGTNVEPLSRNRLERAIYDLLTDLSNWDLITYSPSAVGLWSPYFSDAEGVTAMSVSSVAPASSDQTVSNSGKYTITESTNLIQLYIAGVATDAVTDSISEEAVVNWEGLEVCSATAEDQTRWGSTDALQELDVSTGDTHTLTATATEDGYVGTDPSATGVVLAVWKGEQ